MSSVRPTLGGDERQEYDDLFYEATHFPDGKRRPSRDVGPRLLELLRDAEQAQKPWAGWVIEDALIDGLRAKGNKWCKIKEIVTTKVGARVVTKAAAYGVRKRNTETGKSEWTQPFWEDMDRDELVQVIQGAQARRSSDDELIAIARRFLTLLDEMNADTISDALELKGVTLDAFLAEDVA